MKHDSALFYTCSLIEYIGRVQKLKRAAVVTALGEDTIRRIYRYADVFHCEPLEKTAADWITRRTLPEGSFDNVASCRYRVPDHWTMGEVYARLIEDISDDGEAGTLHGLMQVYTSWIDDALSNYNTDFYYQPRDYIKECYREGTICA